MCWFWVSHATNMQQPTHLSEQSKNGCLINLSRLTPFSKIISSRKSNLVNFYMIGLYQLHEWTLSIYLAKCILKLT